jgi:transposase
MYAVTTDFLDGDVKDILKFSEGRWEIEECFRVMKTDFEIRPVFLHDDVHIKAHFLICFLAVVIYVTSKEIWEMPSATRHSWIN